MKTAETVSIRLRDAIDQIPEGNNFEERVAALHAHVRGMGIKGHHSTRYTLKRWIDGRGTPPPYWINVASEFLGVRPMWLQTGAGVRIAHSEARLEKEARRGPQGSTKPKEEAPKEPRGSAEPKKQEKAKAKRKPKAKAKPKPKPKPKPQAVLSARSQRRKQKAREDKEKIPPPPDPETVVAIPSKEDVFSTKAPEVIQYLERTKSPEAVEAVKGHEEKNPTYAGGRKGILYAAKQALERIGDIEKKKSKRLPVPQSEK